MTVTEMFYTIQEVSMLLRVHQKTVLAKMKSREFGSGVVNIGSEQRPDYRVPASGVNEYLAKHRVFTEATVPGVPTRCTGELRRKVARYEETATN